MKNKFYDINKHGVTHSLLKMFRECREKADLYLQGYSTKDDPKFLFGTIVHNLLDLAYSQIREAKLRKNKVSIPSKSEILSYASKVEKIIKKEISKPSKNVIEEIETAFLFAESLIPIYFAFWKNDLEIVDWLEVEGVFEISSKKAFNTDFDIPVRGKRDGVYRKANGIWLQETKTRSRIVEDDIIDSLPFDFQTNLYLQSIYWDYKAIPKGTDYNLIRKPQLRRKENETPKLFAQRLISDVSDRPEFYFVRLELKTTKQEFQEWKKEAKQVITDFYNWYEENSPHYRSDNHCISSWGRCPYLYFCSGETHHYQKRNVVFSELENE